MQADPDHTRSLGPTGLAQSKDYRIRYWMVLLAMTVAVLLYLDRICLSTASESVERDLGLSSDKLKWILSAFFWTYALAQLPAGWLGDRFGARWVLASYVALWSLSTALLGLAAGVASLLVLRLACGLFEAGAYPVCAGIVRRWVPAPHRGLASGIVSVGGRLGGALAPVLTIELMLWWTYGQSSLALAADVEPAASSWRPVMFLYGGFGILVSILFVWLYRDSPRDHPLVTERELAIIREGEPVAQVSALPLATGEPPIVSQPDMRLASSPTPDSLPEKSLHGASLHGAAPPESSPTDRSQPMRAARRGSPGTLPMRALLTSGSLWLMSYVQFASNFGWAFLVTLLPRYLSDVHHVSQQTQGWMQSLSLGAGIAGLLVGGRLTDLATRLWGLRYGRAALLSLSRGLVTLAFLGCLAVGSPVQAAICLALVGFATDLGIGATWAYGQDVGGRYVGAVVGWGNMWGNLGAALSPIVFGLISDAFANDLPRGWRFAFLFCAAIQALAAVAAIGVSAHRSLDQEDEPTAEAVGMARGES